MQDKKKTIISGLIVGSLVLALGIGVYNSKNTSNSQTVITEAAPVSKIESFLPIPGTTLKGNIEVQAKSKTSENIKNLFAVVKIGDAPSVPLSIERLDSSSILIKGTINTLKYQNGSQTISIYLYTTSTGKTKLIGSNQYRVSISN